MMAMELLQNQRNARISKIKQKKPFSHFWGRNRPKLLLSKLFLEIVYNFVRTTPGAAWAASGASGASVLVPPITPHVGDFCGMILAGESIGMSRWSPQHLAVEADVDPGNHSGWAAGGGGQGGPVPTVAQVRRATRAK